MTTSEQAALLAKHRADVMNAGTEYEWADCRECNVPFPCDVHRMAELKDAEIAQAVSEAVERIVEALGAKRAQDREDAEDESWNVYAYEVDDEILALLRSRDWSKGEGE